MPGKQEDRVPSGPFRHVIGGEAYGKPHEPGDPVSSDTPSHKVREWFRAGVIKKDTKRSTTRSKETT